MHDRLFWSALILTALLMAQSNRKDVLVKDELAEGFDMGVDTDKKARSWVNPDNGSFKVEYPAGQKWGALFVTVGEPVDENRPSMDLSEYTNLVVEMRGGAGGEEVFVGIKTNKQRDKGGEYKVSETLTSSWQKYSYPLKQFREKGTDPKALYIVAEFVFSGKAAKTIYVRSIRYEK